MNHLQANMLKAILFGGILISPSYATYARLESMGKSSKFIMDDMSIFDNPANINIYPNFLILCYLLGMDRLTGECPPQALG